VDKLRYTYAGNRLLSVLDGGTVRTAPRTGRRLPRRADAHREYFYDDNHTYGKGKRQPDRRQKQEDHFDPLQPLEPAHPESSSRTTRPSASTTSTTLRAKAQKDRLRAGQGQRNDRLRGQHRLRQQRFAVLCPPGGPVLSPQAANQAGFVYEYQYRDHLGNLRVSFRQGSVSPYRVTMEPSSALTRSAVGPTWHLPETTTRPAAASTPERAAIRPSSTARR
jgi:hypothetical protein